MPIVNNIEVGFYKRNWINDWIWKCCFLYLITLIFVTPLYKFGQVYLGFPNINLSAVRALIMFLTFCFLLLKNKITIYEKNILKSLIPAILSIFIAILFTAIAPFFVFKYSTEATKIYLTRIDTLIGYIMMFLLGFYFDYQNGNKYRPYFIMMWLIFSVFILVNVNFLLAAFFYYNSEFEDNISYLLISEAYVILSIFTLSLIKNKPLVFFIWLVTLVVLFFMPSRANTAGFILASVIGFLNWKRLIYIALIAPLLFLIVIKYTSNSDLFENSRVLTTDITKDESLQARQQIERDNMTNLKEHWLFGDFMGDVRIHKEDGYYFHNILSRLQEYSLFYLVFFITAIGVAIYYLFLLRHSVGEQYRTTLMLTIFSLPLVFLFRGSDLILPYFVLSRSSVLLWSSQLNYKIKQLEKTNILN